MYYFRKIPEKSKNFCKPLKELSENPFSVADPDILFPGDRFVEFPLLLSKFFRDFENEMEHGVPLPVSGKARKALSFEFQLGFRLGAGLELDRLLSEDRDVHLPFRPEDELHRIELHVEMEVEVVPGESLELGRNPEMDEQIPASILSFVSFVSKFDRHGVVDPCGDIDRARAGDFCEFLSVAGFAGVPDRFSGSAAVDADRSLLDDSKDRPHVLSNLPGPLAVRAGNEVLFRFRARSMTCWTNGPFRKGDLFLRSENRFLEGKRKVQLDILSDVPPTSSGSAEASAEEGLENIGESAHVPKPSGKTASRSLHCPEAVVVGAFALIRKDRVRFSELFEFRLFGLVSVVAVRMELHRFFSVGALDRLVRRSPVDSEYVVIFVCHGRNCIEARGIASRISIKKIPPDDGTPYVFLFLVGSPFPSEHEGEREKEGESHEEERVGRSGLYFRCLRRHFSYLSGSARRCSNVGREGDALKVFLKDSWFSGLIGDIMVVYRKLDESDGSSVFLIRLFELVVGSEGAVHNPDGLSGLQGKDIPFHRSGCRAGLRSEDDFRTECPELVFVRRSAQEGGPVSPEVHERRFHLFVLVDDLLGLVFVRPRIVESGKLLSDGDGAAVETLVAGIRSEEGLGTTGNLFVIAGSGEGDRWGEEEGTSDQDTGKLHKWWEKEVIVRGIV